MDDIIGGYAEPRGKERAELMGKPRKMLGNVDAPYLQSLMRLNGNPKQNHHCELVYGLCAGAFATAVGTGFPEGCSPEGRAFGRESLRGRVIEIIGGKAENF